MKKPPKNVIQLTKYPLKHYLKNPLQNDIKAPFFYCNTYEFDFSVDVVEG